MNDSAVAEAERFLAPAIDRRKASLGSAPSIETLRSFNHRFPRVILAVRNIWGASECPG
jgi:hypothetical protein